MLDSTMLGDVASTCWIRLAGSLDLIDTLMTTPEFFAQDETVCEIWKPDKHSSYKIIFGAMLRHKIKSILWTAFFLIPAFSGQRITP